MGERDKFIPALIGIAMIIAGIFIFINAESTFFAIAKILGWVALISGVLFIYSYLKMPGMSSIAGKLKLVTGGLLVILGGLFIAKPELIGNILGYVVAFWFILQGISSMANIGYLKYVNRPAYTFSMILNIALILLGIIILINPLIIGMSISIVISLAMVLGGISYIMVFLGNSR